MKKISDEKDNPIDNLLIKISDYLCPYFKKLGHTPNTITTYSLISGIISIYFLYNGYSVFFSIFYMLSYFFDCMDGHYARKYNMTSKFGDLYDHIKDVFVYVLLLATVYIKYKNKIKLIDFIIIIISLFISFIHLGCQQKNYEKDEKEILDNFIYLCKDKDYIYYTRWFGMGTLTIITIIIIVFIIKR